jgi:hypothetical protein
MSRAGVTHPRESGNIAVSAPLSFQQQWSETWPTTTLTVTGTRPDIGDNRKVAM